jgi:methionyl-tRNA synthetase
VVCNERGADFTELWGETAFHYYVHGKDNIPFHTIILPSLLLAHGGGYRLPDSIISSEYMTLEGRKISTSQNWAIWVKDIVKRYNPDALRYFFIAAGPEKRDADFSFAEFIERNNNELLGSWGNLVNRTLAFIAKYLGGVIPNGTTDPAIESEIGNAFDVVGKLIEDGHLKEALDRAFELVRFGNRYYDAEKPWETRNTDSEKCGNTLYNCTALIANLAVLLEPFLPFSSRKIFDWLGIKTEWKPQNVAGETILPEISILFERIDKSVAESELQTLTNA